MPLLALDMFDMPELEGAVMLECDEECMPELDDALDADFLLPPPPHAAIAREKNKMGKTFLIVVNFFIFNCLMYGQNYVVKM